LPLPVAMPRRLPDPFLPLPISNFCLRSLVAIRVPILCSNYMHSMCGCPVITTHLRKRSADLRCVRSAAFLVRSIPKRAPPQRATGLQLAPRVLSARAPKTCPRASCASLSRILTKGRIFCLTRFTLARQGACHQKEAKMPIGQAKCMKTIQNNPKMRTIFQPISMKINVL